MQPSTYLLTSPDEPNAVGRTMTFSEIRAGLQKANRNVVIPPPREFAMATGFTGLTCIWIGPPQPPCGPPNGSTKVCSIRAGVIPEFTILRANGNIQTKGWRAIFEKCIVTKLATQARLEYLFDVKLDTDRKARQKWCPWCQKGGRWIASTSKNGLCDTHSWVMQDQKRLANMSETMNALILKETGDAIRSES